MPQEPKKRHSRQRQGKRRAHLHLELSDTTRCSNCQATIRFHSVCPACGFYNGKKIMAGKKTDKKVTSDENAA